MRRDKFIAQWDESDKFAYVWETGTNSSTGFESDEESDLDSASSDWFDLSSARAPSSVDRWVGFSSQFSERMGGPEGLQEELF